MQSSCEFHLPQLFKRARLHLHWPPDALAAHVLLANQSGELVNANAHAGACMRVPKPLAAEARRARRLPSQDHSPTAGQAPTSQPPSTHLCCLDRRRDAARCCNVVVLDHHHVKQAWEMVKTNRPLHSQPTNAAWVHTPTGQMQRAGHADHSMHHSMHHMHSSTAAHLSCGSERRRSAPPTCPAGAGRAPSCGCPALLCACPAAQQWKQRGCR